MSSSVGIMKFPIYAIPNHQPASYWNCSYVHQLSNLGGPAGQGLGWQGATTAHIQQDAGQVHWFNHLPYRSCQSMVLMFLYMLSHYYISNRILWNFPYFEHLVGGLIICAVFFMGKSSHRDLNFHVKNRGMGLNPILSLFLVMLCFCLVNVVCVTSK